MVGINELVQIWIACTGLVAVWLTQQSWKPHWAKYACLLGMASQPAWFYTTLVHEQWGIFVLSLFYTYAWWQGIRRHWLAKSV